MPTDSEGNRADIIMDPNSTINRANPGRLFEQYFNASARDTHKRLCAMLKLEPGMKAHKAHAHILKRDANERAAAWNYLQQFYRIVSPRMAQWFDEGKVPGTSDEYLSEIVELGIGIYFPTNNSPMSQDIVNELERPDLGYKPVYGPVTYVGNSGRRVTTVKPVRIGPIYLILLEKIGDDWGSVSSGKLQHHGVLSQLTRNDKYSNPARNQPVRGAGEAEVRIFASYVDTRYVAEMMDLNNNPRIHRVVVDGLLSAKQPTNVDQFVNRDLYPFGGAKPLVITRHLMATSGVDFHFTDYASDVQHFSTPTFSSNREANAADARDEQ